MAKSALIAFSALVCLWMISGARAAGTEITDIKQAQQADGSFAVDFVLNQPVAKDQVAVEYQRNFIQVTLHGVSTYPARTTKLSDARMEKVFTYQYQPDVTRARVLLKGQASGIQALSSMQVDGEHVRILVKAGGKVADDVKSKAAAPVSAEELKAREEIASGGATPSPAAVVAAAKAASSAATAAAPSPAASIAASPAKPIDQESLPIFSPATAAKETKETTGAASRVFTALILVLGLIGAGTLGFKKFAKTTGMAMPFQRQPKMIDVISTQSMGPKRSIAIVKVLDKYLVVGMAGESMSLLSDMGTNVNIEKYLDEATPGGSFAGTFTGVLSSAATAKETREIAANNTPKHGVPVGASSVDTMVPRNSGSGGGSEHGIRSAIKKRLEGFKPL